MTDRAREVIVHTLKAWGYASGDNDIQSTCSDAILAALAREGYAVRSEAEVDAAVAEAVRAERERLTLLVLRMIAEPPGTLDRIAAAIREEDKP